MCVLTWHGGVTVTKILQIVGLSAALVLAAASGTYALEEQKAPVTPEAAAAGAAATDTAAPAAKKDEGTEIRIPGLGRLGTLPKMDFGLELLYGATETEKSREPSGIEDGNEDLTIKGSIKHKF